MSPPCPHIEAVRVGDQCYWDLKLKALNGGRSKLTAEQLEFVRCVEVPVYEGVAGRAWVPATADPRYTAKLDELSKLMDVMPNWVRLARELVKDDGS